jgi:glucose-6-phosphate 1-dehydrogenase
MSTELMESFLEKIFYFSGDIEQAEWFEKLKQEVTTVENDWGVCTNKLFYLAIPPNLFGSTSEQLAQVGLTEPCSDEDGWTRILIEKPFGYDTQSATKLNSLLSKLFKEEQIYRIDHYLAKEINQSILTFRFSNNLFEPSWHSQYISSIQLRLLESLGVEERGAFFDQVGMLRDVGANHLLQLLALVTMEQPQSLETPDIRQARFELLQQIAPIKDVTSQTFRAQYSSYQEIEGVKPSSQTETYFKIKLAIDHPRWQDVEVVLEAGKKLGQEINGAQVTYRHPNPCLCPIGSAHTNNRVEFSSRVPEGIKVTFNTKKPTYGFELTQEQFRYSLHTKNEETHINEYEQVLLDCFNGDQMRFVSTQEVEELWRIVDPIVDAWQENRVPLETYTPAINEVVQKAQEKIKSN